MKIIDITNIDWDTTDEDGEHEVEWLPSELKLTMSEEELQDDDAVVNYLSDKFGYCINSCSIKISDKQLN